MQQRPGADHVDSGDAGAPELSLIHILGLAIDANFRFKLGATAFFNGTALFDNDNFFIDVYKRQPP